MATIYSHSVSTQFTAPRFSLAYIFSTACTILTLLIPFYLCFSPRYALNSTAGNDSLNSRTTLATPVGVWLKHDSYREQPKVKFQYKVIFVAQAEEKVVDTRKRDNVTLLPKEIYYSTFDELNEKRQKTFRAASTKSREADDDLDGVVDRLLLNINIPLENNESIYGIQALVFVTYKLENHVKMEMESLIHVHHESGLAGSRFISIGDLNLRQMKPIPIISGSENEIVKIYVDKPLAKTSSTMFEPGRSNVNNILREYQSRNIAADYVERFPIWTRQIKESVISSKNSASEEDKQSFELDLTVTIPKMQSILYVPTLMEVLTEAWIRYLSLLVITGSLARLLFQFVFPNQLLYTDIFVS